MKRLFDYSVATLGLFLFSPVLLLSWITIVFTSGFPGIFRQKRIGLNGRHFKIYKFRTMHLLKGAEKGSFDAGSRIRVTLVGKFFRKTKLDELPQLWNVACGDMSIVGPRPEVEKWVRVYPERWSKVLSVKPGITDNASIEFCNEEDILEESDDPERTYREVILPRKLDLYEAYVKTQSFKNDIKIILKTAIAVFQK